MATHQIFSVGLACLIALHASDATAACNDIPLADQPDTTLCIADMCEEARLALNCGNIHYSSSSYETPTARWLFRIRHFGTHHEYSVFIDNSVVGAFSFENQLSDADIDQVTCIEPEGRSQCAFIDGVLGKYIPLRQ